MSVGASVKQLHDGLVKELELDLAVLVVEVVEVDSSSSSALSVPLAYSPIIQIGGPRLRFVEGVEVLA